MATWTTRCSSEFKHPPLVMAAIAAFIPRQLFAFSSALFPSSSSSIFGSAWSIPLLPSLRDIIPSFVFAVPKKKVSHSRKAMRSANKGLKDKQSRQISLRSICYVLTSLQTWFIALDVVQQNSHIIYVLIATPALIGRGSPNRKTTCRHP